MCATRSKIRIGLAQVNPTVGDLAGNLGMVRRMIGEAKRAGVQLLAFPELVLCGYPPEDLLLKPSFLRDCEAVLHEAARTARGIAVIVGSPEPPTAPGEELHNDACILFRGKIAARYRKIYLPNYGVFDEKRYFGPGDRALVAGFGRVRIGVNICEDIWAENGPMPAQVFEGGAGVVINISASPYHRRKGPERERLMRRRARENHSYLCYVNLLGGQDELVFDGGSVIMSPDGECVARGRPFEEDLIIADITPPPASHDPDRARLRGCKHPIELVDLPDLPGRRPVRSGRRRMPEHPAPDEELYRALVLGTRDYTDKNRFKGVTIGLSGGIDSALTASIAVDALGCDRVLGITMPFTYTSDLTLRDSRILAENLGIRLLEIPITDHYRAYVDSLREAFRGTARDSTEENIQARVRGNILMAVSNKFDLLVLTTGNKSEIAVGYCTLYGDMAGGFAVLKDVPKTLVYSLCRYRNRAAGRKLIPASIIRRKPSAELRPGQLDEDTLPPYGTLDRIVELYVEHDLSFDEITEKGLDPDAVEWTIRMIDRNEYKRRQGPPGIKITPKAFGRDRRMPITSRYAGSRRG